MQPNSPRHSAIETIVDESALEAGRHTQTLPNTSRKEKLSFPQKLKRSVAALVAGPLATTGLVAVSTEYNDTIATYVQLADKNADLMFGEEPSLDYTQYDAPSAITITEETFGLQEMPGYYIDNIDVNGLKSVKGLASTWHLTQILLMYEAAKIMDTDPDKKYEERFDAALAAIDTYWSDSPEDYPGGYDANKSVGIGKYDRFVDDNAWLAQLHLREYYRTGDVRHIEKAKKFVDLFLSQVSPDDDGAFWKVQFPEEENRDQAVVSNATAIPVLIGLYTAGYGELHYLQVAERTYTWLQQFKDPETGLYYDKMTPDGVDKTYYTYVQGQMLESMIHMNKADPEAYPIEDAVAFAHLTLDYFATHGGYENSTFAAIYLRSILGLASEVYDRDLALKAIQGIELAKRAILTSPKSISDAASTAQLFTYDEMPRYKWRQLQPTGQK